MSKLFLKLSIIMNLLDYSEAPSSHDEDLLISGVCASLTFTAEMSVFTQVLIRCRVPGSPLTRTLMAFSAGHLSASPLSPAVQKMLMKSCRFGVLKLFILHGQVTGREVPHDPSWSLPLQAYAAVHFLLVLWTYHELFQNKMVSIKQVCGDLKPVWRCCFSSSDEPGGPDFSVFVCQHYFGQLGRFVVASSRCSGVLYLSGRKRLPLSKIMTE